MTIRPRAGPATLVLFEGPDRVRAKGSLRLETMWINEGGEATGLRVTAWGPALDRGLLELTGARVGAPPGQAVALSAARVGSESIRSCELPDFVVAPGVEPDGGPASSEELDRIGAAMIVVALEGPVLAAGRAALHVSVGPLDAREGDVLSVQLDLRA